MGNHRSSTVAGVVALALLSGCPTVDLGDTPSDIGLCNPQGGLAYFQTEIWPKFVGAGQCTKAGACHSETGGNALSFKTMPIDYPFNYRQTQIYLNCGQPMASELLTKPLAGQDPHGGGDIAVPVDVFVQWFM
jgi:hypothetical protein